MRGLPARRRARGDRDGSVRFGIYADRSGGPSACWPWRGSIEAGGYGWLKVEGRMVKAHRLSWTLHVGPIPDGMLVCHHCDNSPCVNWRHLFLGTYLDNNRDRDAKGRGRWDAGPRGEDHGRAVLSEGEVVAIREAYLAGGRTMAVLGREFGVCQTQVQRIVKGQKWTHLDPAGQLSGDLRRRLTESMAIEIIQQYARGGVSQAALGVAFGVNEMTVFRLLTGRSWQKSAAVRASRSQLLCKDTTK